MAHIMIDCDHKFDKDVVEFFNTIEHLGSGNTVNFISSPMYHRQRGRGGGGGRRETRCGNAQFDLGGGGASKTTRDKLKGGCTTRSGVLKDLHLAFITLVGESPNSKLPL